METLTITKSKEINAPKEKVWNLLIEDEATRAWYAEFNPGAYAETDWREGSKVQFLDKDRNGLLGRIIVNKPGAALSVEYDGFVIEGKEDIESPGAKEAKGGHESYYLSEQNGVTTLAIEADMSDEYFEMMSSAWDRALDKIKDMAEK